MHRIQKRILQKAGGYGALAKELAKILDFSRYCLSPENQWTAGQIEGLTKALGSPYVLRHLSEVKRLQLEFAQIEEVVERINRFDDLAREKRYNVGDYYGENKEEVDRLRGAINKFFGQFTASLGLALPLENGWVGGPEMSSEDMPFLQGWAHKVLGAATRGYLRKVRRCAECGKWYARVREIQRRCSTNCRVKSAHKTESGRRKQREYMRRYRAGLRRRDAENLRVMATRKRRRR
jgi:hypothetical protein